MVDGDPEEFPEGNDEVIAKGPCPECGSSDANVLYADGHEHCYSKGCGHYKPAPKGGINADGDLPPGFTRAAQQGPSTKSPDLLYPERGDAGVDPWGAMGKRNITSHTLRRYGVFTAGYSGHRVQVYPYYGHDGNLMAQKLRHPGKDFTVLKGPGYIPLQKGQLFGRHVFGDKYDRMVVVTEGELDALSVAQAMDFKCAVVSVNTGADGAAKCCKANYLWLDRFSDIVLWLDDDEPGKEAAEDIAKLFKVGKVRIARAEGFKDASAVLQGNKPGTINDAIWAATAWRPRGIINASEGLAALRAPREKVVCYHYPDFLPKLDEMTGGIMKGEVIYHVAGTGVGKSSVLREVQYDLMANQGAKIAVLSFEDTVREAQLGLMSIAANERLGLIPMPDPEVATEEDFAQYDGLMEKWHSKVLASGRVELFDPQTAEWTMEAILGYVRYCAKALDCEVIFLDPISFIASSIELTADERRVLDRVAGELAKLAKELDINLQVSHHLRRVGQGIPHEEGAPTSLNELRSSGGLANFAMCVVGWERNNQAAGDAWRVMRARVLKQARRVGKSGLADVIYYGENGRYTKSPLDFPPIGKAEKPEEYNSGGGFKDDGEF